MSDEFEFRRIAVKGGEIAVMEAGAGDPLLLLHAAGLSDLWLPAYSRLAERFRVIVPQHPGFGQSPTIDAIETVENLAYHYDDLLTLLGLESVKLVGVSFGGWVAAELAVLSPQRIESLVLIDALGLRVPGSPVTDTFEMAAEAQLKVLFHDPAVPQALFPAEPDIDFLMKLYRDEVAFARYAWVPFCNNPKLAGRLHRVAAPTLVLWAEHDKIVPAAHGARYAELIAGASLEIIPGAGHSVLIEQPVPCAEAIIRFATPAAATIASAAA